MSPFMIIPVIGLIGVIIAIGMLIRQMRLNSSAPLQPPRPRVILGACGVNGCPNQRPHSHVLDLVKRIKEK